MEAAVSDQPKPGHGGKRLGAGRKGERMQTLSIPVPAELKAWIMANGGSSFARQILEDARALKGK